MNGKEIVKHFEGLRLEAYLCPAGVPTIGYGHTKGVRLGDKITPDMAEQLLNIDFAEAEEDLMQVVKVPLTDAQKGALTSFVFNLGIGALRTSTLLKKLNSGDYNGAAEEFNKWVYSNKVKLSGLVKRRAIEKELFNAKYTSNT